ncbi:MAG: transposase [Flavobacteriales bacterium]|nr:transposase [Flavobacteriia bacterium]NCP06016.1 transposase [Flavobacteriales bacterium]PIV93188.1 MAG: hypothetical protein COW44_10830 [Flavobacteriaceae bacterium CG17_big_fil_post_rev_8_21_14_2_50_33_15]NCP52990.1 transposase [Flavobacteriales bacterium]NCP60291.1 transposase [Flavobacteriales bacterium]
MIVVISVKAFNTIANTITLNYKSILNYFINKSTNAYAESFNGVMISHKLDKFFSKNKKS